ncbi:DUF1778 domain-containing protein [Marinicella sp. W31]|uniref:type II toxin-antitoxin system TacA family antitoxin n=1 Tax=Marinicella sp. W31 TaxID=3023713 RepID=UPI00375746CB
MSKTATINMRLEPRQQSLLTKAAAVLNKDRSSFILDAACREAEHVLLDRRYFLLDDKEFENFEKLLESDIPNKSELTRLLNEPTPWEK